MVNVYEEKRLIQISLIILTIMILVFGVWGYLAPLNSVVVATGKVTVEGENKHVQHLEGGIVVNILVEKI